MGSAKDVFERIEKKYVVDDVQRKGVEDALDATHRIDAFGTSKVTSVYFDTPRCLLIERSLERPLYKEKLRVRAYGQGAGMSLVRAFDPAMGGHLDANEAPTPVFIELKKKLFGVVYKRRIAAPLQAAVLLLAGSPYKALRASEIWRGFEDPLLQSESRSAQISSEIRSFMERLGQLSPSMAIACERTALEPVVGEDEQRGCLRVTFDEDIKALPMRMDGASWFSVLDDPNSLMEIKNQGPLDIGLSRTLAKERLYPRSFSKYGRAHRLLQQGRREVKGALSA